MKANIFMVMASGLLLVGCGQLVGSNSMPDEMAVVSGPALTIPPNFELRPPSEERASKAEAIRNTDSSREARNILMGDKQGRSAEGSDWLLEQVGADAADPNIRQELGNTEAE